jgi:hypothetical protein
MTGPEMMIAKLLGIKPEEMKQQIESALRLMKTGAQAAEKMQHDIDLIKNHLGIYEMQESKDNGGRAISDNRGTVNGDNRRIQL